MRFLHVLRIVEETQLDAGRVLGEEREVHPLAVPRGTKGIRLTRPHSHLDSSLAYTLALHAGTFTVAARPDSIDACSSAPPDPPKLPASVDRRSLSAFSDRVGSATR